MLLIVLDSARADAFEPYGAPAGSSPAVAQLASSGAAASDVFATASWTVPSHASIFTGLLPRAAGMQGAPGMGFEATAPAFEEHTDRVLAEVLRRRGYRTAAVSTNLWLSRSSGFATGFDEFVSIDSEVQVKIHNRGLRWLLQAARADGDDGAAAAGGVLRRWIDAARNGQPRFWFVNLIECHSPCLPPRTYSELGPLGRVRAAIEARRHLNLPAIWRTCAGGVEVPAPALERMRRQYAAAVRYQDTWVADALESLDDAGILDQTVVIVTADHGENLGENGLISHALSLDDRLLRVPFVLAGPGSSEISSIRSLAELPRLVAELAGIGDHPWPHEELPEDAAVAQLDPPLDPDDPKTAAAVAEWDLDQEGFSRLTSRQTCAADGRWKLLRRGGQELLFDTASDPLELAPMRADDPDLDPAALGSLRAALEHPANSTALAAGSGERQALPEDRRRDLEERMRVLGYL